MKRNEKLISIKMNDGAVRRIDRSKADVLVAKGKAVYISKGEYRKGKDD